MPAPTIPESDEELEKLIESWCRGSSQNLWNGDDGFSIEQLRHACEEIAAFSARRAREKAIEEYHAQIMDFLTSNGCGYIAEDLNKHLLKTKPQ